MKIFFRNLNQFWQKIPPINPFVIFFAVSVLLIIGFMQFSVDEDLGACSPTQHFGQCYDIPRPLCETTLVFTKASCESLVKNLTKPGQLVGPIQRNCEQLKFDRVLKYTRRSDSICTDRINYLESWQKTNPDF